MYLSRLDLQLSSPAVRQALRNCQDMHRTLMKAFDCTREEACLLYRIMKTDQCIFIYSQSFTLPKWERIEKYGYHCAKIQNILSLHESFKEEMALRFSLLACPTKKVKGDGQNSRRVLLRSREERLEWLKRQGEKNGFLVHEAYEAADEQALTGSKDSGEFFITGIPFQGILSITNKEAFWRGFQHGIGPEKPYGFGMLMIERLKQ